MKYVLLACALANYLSFFFAVIRIFRVHKELQTLQFRLLQLNTIALWIAGPLLIWNATPHFGYVYIIAIQLMSFLAFWMTSQIAKKNSFTAVYSKDTPQRLVKNGPYKYIRHPFYVIYLTTYASLLFIQPSALYSALVVSITVIYIHAARAEEGKFQASGLSEEYKRYRSETGMFFPKLLNYFILKRF